VGFGGIGDEVMRRGRGRGRGRYLGCGIARCDKKGRGVVVSRSCMIA